MSTPNPLTKFHDIPPELDILRKQIKNEDLYKLYSKIFFMYYNQSQETQKIKPFLLNLLKEYNFITIDSIQTNESGDLSNAIICFEKSCLIIESIKTKSLNSIIKKLKSSIIDLRLKHDDINLEVTSFCSAFKNSIENNRFLQITIKAISAYLIRRHFYPSSYFKDPSFFTYNEKKKSEKEILNNDYTNFNRENLFNKVKRDKKKMNKSNPIIEFDEKEFIILRSLHTNYYAKFDLVIHKKSFHLFMMKTIFNNKNEYENLISHEIEFCEHYSHRCIVHFYGFVIKNKVKIGFIYEFMSNGSLENYIELNKFDDKFANMTIYRLVQAIYYLHSNKLIHRDIKPYNILIDHDNIPYLSDFETIKKIDSPLKSMGKMTGNLGSLIYISPEQFDEEYSFPTDIYSFGLTIYFLFEKEHINDLNGFTNNHKLDKEKVKKFIENSNYPKVMRHIFERCSQYVSKNRPTIYEINNMLFNDLSSFYFLDPALLLENKDNKEICQYFIEIYNLLFISKEMTSEILKKYEIQLFQLINIINKTEISKILFSVGYYYYDGDFENRDYKKAKEYLDASAKLNNYDAISTIGRFYYFGIIVKQDFDKAREHFELGCQHNNPIAQCFLGVLYFNGNGVERNHDKAKELFYLSAQQKYGNAFINIGCLYYMGAGVEQNFIKALEYFEIAVKMNNSNFALNNIGNIYLNGLGVHRDYEKAKHYLELAAKQQFPLAQYNLGNMYRKALGVVRDYQKAKKYYELSAQQNCTLSIYQLGKLYLNGNGIEIDYKKAKEYFELSIKTKYNKGFYQLGLMYKNGHGVEQNYEIAKKYFDLSANSFNSDACYQIGTLYYYGYLGNPDFKKARDWFEASSKMNNLNAYFYLGSLYENGDGVNIDISLAIEYYEKCAKCKKSSYISKTSSNKYALEFEEKSIYNNHYYQSNNNLGLIYMTEENHKNIELAESYFKEAGLNEYPIGQNNLGLFFQYFSNNLENAIYMFEKAAKHHLSVSEFNFGHVYELQGNVDKCIEHYNKASEYENKILIFRNQIIDDKHLEISKSFIICFTNLKLAQYYRNLNEKNSNDHLMKALFRPIFKLLFSMKSKSITFDFELIQINGSYFVTNLKDFIMNFPLFFVNSAEHRNSSSAWNLQENQINDDAEIILLTHVNGAKENSKKNDEMKKYIINDNNKSIENIYLHNEQIVNIFSYMNNQNQFEIISNKNESDYETLLIKTKRNNIIRKLMYSKKLINALVNTIKFMNDIIEIIKEINQILFNPPYTILFGRINAHEFNKSLTNQREIARNIDGSFYTAFNE